MNTFSQLLLSALHNATAAAVATVAPIAIAMVNQGPTGNALVYAQAHPAVLLAYGLAAMVARDLLKAVPAFGTVSTAPAVTGAAK